MNAGQRLVRTIASLLPRFTIRRLPEPRAWLLERAHHQWVGLLPLTMATVGDLLGVLRVDMAMWALVVGYAACSFGADVTGLLAHRLWLGGRLWQDTACPCCDDHGGGWWFESGDLIPDGPEDRARTPDDSRHPSPLKTITTPRERAAQAAYAALTRKGLR